MNVINYVATCCTVLILFQIIVSDYIVSSCPQLVIINGKVRLRSRGRVARFRCDASYQLVGNRTATCIRGTWDTNIPLCIRNDCPALPKVKNGYWIENYKGAAVTVICNDGYILHGTRVIYCQNQTWSNSLPFCNEIRTSCDFEKEDLCGWTQKVSNFTWSRHSDATPSGHVGTGPSFDHTLGQGFDGHYLYIESSSPYSENDTARLFSPIYDSSLSQEACFMFWYHMYGVTIGKLNVYQNHVPGNLSDEITLFHKSGEQGNQWIFGYANLTAVNNQFQIVIEAIRGRSYMSDIAIDDVKLTNKQECINTETKQLIQPTTQITVSSSPMTTAPAVGIPKTVKTYPTFLPPPPPPDLLPLPSLPYFTIPPLPPFIYPFDPVNLRTPSVNTLVPRQPFRFHFPPFFTTQIPVAFRSSSTFLITPTSPSPLPQTSLPQTPFLPPFETSRNTITTQNISRVHFKSSTLLGIKSPVVTIVDQIKTTQLPSRRKFPETQVSFTSSTDTNKIQNTNYRTSSYFLSTIIQSTKHNPIVSKHARVNFTYIPHITTKTFDIENSSRTKTFILSTNFITPVYVPLPTTPFQPQKKNNAIPTQINLPTPAPSLKPNIRNVTESLAYHPNQRTTSRFNIIPSIKRGYRTTSEPSTKIKESTAEAKVSHVPSIAGAVGGLIGIAIIAALLILILSRRITRFKKHRDMSEDSDVRFLTSDEVLDFSLARPSHDDDL